MSYHGASYGRGGGSSSNSWGGGRGGHRAPNPYGASGRGGYSTQHQPAPHFASPADAEAAYHAALANLSPPAGPTVYILRGPSGSGKSSITKAIVDSLPNGTRTAVCSADAYFIDPRDGMYKFNREHLTEAHQSCRVAFDDALRQRVPVIIVDNTHTQRWEYAPFVAGVVGFNDAVSQGRIAGVSLDAAGSRPSRVSSDSSFPGTQPVSGWESAHSSAASSTKGTSGSGGWAAAGFVASDQWHARSAQSPAAVDQVFADRDRQHRGGYALLVVELSVPNQTMLERCFRRNTHGVPLEAITRQWENLRHSHDPHAVIVPAFFPRPSTAPVPLASTGAPVTPGRGWSSVAGSTAGAGGAASHPPAESSASRNILSQLFDQGMQLGVRQGSQVVDRPVRVPSGTAVVYMGLFLTRESKHELLAAFPPLFGGQVHGDHVTVMHAPPQSAITQRLVGAVGQKVQLTVTGTCSSSRMGAQAAMVSWPKFPRHDGASSSCSSDDGQGEDEAGEGGMGAGHEEDAAHWGTEPTTPCRGGREGLALATPDGVTTDRTLEAAHDGGDDTSSLQESTEAVRSLLAAIVPRPLSTALPVAPRTAGMSTNVIPHVTLSVAHGVPPASSNEMLVTKQQADNASGAAGRAFDRNYGIRTTTLRRRERVKLTARLGLCVVRGTHRWYVTNQHAVEAWLAGGHRGGY